MEIERKIRERLIYLIVAQKTLREGCPYRVSVQTKTSSAPVLIVVKILARKDICLLEQSFTLNGDELKLVEFYLSNLSTNLSDEDLKLQVQFLEPNSKELITQENADISFEPISRVCLIQLDKPLYRPNESVRCRILLLNSPKLTPCVDQPISVLFKDSKDNLIKRFSSDHLNSGIGQYEYQLSDQPPLGNWTVLVQHGQNKSKSFKQFEVLEYVLPTFEAKVEMNKKFSLESGIINGNVIANYTFGKPVTATAQAIIECKSWCQNNEFWPEDEPLKEFKFQVELNQGTGSFELDLIRKMNLAKSISQSYYITSFDFKLKAIVTDLVSEKQVETCTEFSLVQSKYDLKILNKYQQNYIPGFKHKLLLSLTDSDNLPVSCQDDGDAINFGWKFETNLHDPKSDQKFSEVKLYPVEGLVEYEFDTPKDSSQILLRAKFRNEKFNLGYVTNVCSKHDIQLRFLEQERRPCTRHLTGEVGEPLRFMLNSQQEVHQVQVYVINSNLNTLLHFEIFQTKKPGQNQLNFELNPTAEWRHKVIVIAMLVYKDDAFSVDKYRHVYEQLKIRIIANQKSNIRFDGGVEQAQPGGHFHLNIISSPHSLVGSLGMDFALQLMRQGNDITESDVLEALKSNEKKSGGRSCVYYDRVFPLLILENYTSKNRLEVDGSSDLGNSPVDENMLFRASAPMGKLFAAKTCRVALAERAYELEPHIKPQVQIRKNFPETFLWTLTNSDSNGVAKIDSTIPDTITKWIITAFSLDRELGLSITSNPHMVNVFKPFFVNLNLPISAKRGETIQIQAIVFNYLDKPQKNVQVTLKIRMKDDFSTSSAKENTFSLSIPSQQNKSVDFWFKCDQIGQMELIVVATCDEFIDQVIKNLSVKPEGESQHLSESHLICLKEGKEFKKFSLSFPSVAISDSRRIEITVNGDILAKTLANLDRLVRVPYGCGEQNMVNFVPNCLVFNYLRQLNKLEPKMRSKMEKNARLGYQRELTYQRNDGSFSAFGQHDSNGSTWLTAFVLRSFTLGKDICDIDVNILEKAYKWLVKNRSFDGGFVEVGFVHDKVIMGAMNDLNKKTSNHTLTAYVIIALYELQESKLLKVNENLNLLVKDLKRVLGSDLNCYSLTLITYALHLVNSQFKDEAWQLLWIRRQEKGNLIFWSDKKASVESSDNLEKLKKYDENSMLASSATLEITAYAVLTMCLRYDQPVDCYRAASYLIANQNSFGGFSATQDTVVGLQALCAFAIRLPSIEGRNLNLRILDQNGDFLSSFNVNATNQMELQSLAHSEYHKSSVDLDQAKRWLAVLSSSVCQGSSIISIEAEGVGTAAVQMNLNYNLLQEQKESAFQLKVKKQKHNSSGFLSLTLLVTFVKQNKLSSNMAIMELEFPTGFVADQEALDLYRNKHSDLIKRLELQNDNTKIVYYFEKFNQNLSQEVEAFANQLIDVKDRKESTIKVYDYYERQDYARIFYKI